MEQPELLKRILAIQNDGSLTDAEKAIQRQALLSGQWKDESGGGKKRWWRELGEKGLKGHCRLYINAAVDYRGFIFSGFDGLVMFQVPRIRVPGKTISGMTFHSMKI